MLSKFRNAGQTCVCANRILVQRDICPRFSARLLEVVATLKVGDGFTPGSAIGPVIANRFPLAQALVAALMQNLRGEFLHIDTDASLPLAA